ncbi:MAG: transaldolase [Pseudomonas sp.]|uniref:transaldolase n=1 Tax=Pseudomonas sp. TaxID=306 RepID=UPI002FCBDBE6
MPSLLNQLKTLSSVVADTGDLDVIRRFVPQDATTNPSLILKAAQSGQYDSLLDKITADCERLDASLDERVDDACDRWVVAMGGLILQHVNGRVSTEVNARLSFDTEASLSKARKLVALYEASGISRDRILIKLAATWEGIRAAQVLEQEGIQCNLTLIFSLTQARACAEAGAYLISPFVGRILDWYGKNTPDVVYPPAKEPGVVRVAEIYRYLRLHKYPTVVMGASFRNSGEILALAGCDRLTISPSLLAELEGKDGVVVRAMAQIESREDRPSRITEAAFRWELNEDAMATEKLAEGIRGFEADQRKLEALVRSKFERIDPSVSRER